MMCKVFILIWTLSVLWYEIDGVLWGLLLANPSFDEHSQIYGRKSVSKLPNDDHLITDVPIKAYINSHHGIIFCEDDSKCKNGMFCDRHYGVCDYRRKDGDQCRQHHHCEKGHECVFGRCRKYVKKGEKGSRCQSDSDCGTSMCCGRHHGEYLCKERLPLGHKCFVPNGGLHYTLNEMCPCEIGLVCKHIDKSYSKQDGASFGRRLHDIMRCRPA